MELERPEDEPLPGDWKRMQEFDKLLLFRWAAACGISFLTRPLPKAALTRPACARTAADDLLLTRNLPCCVPLVGPSAPTA